MPMTRRKQQAIETKQKLLDAADALVKERGFDAVSVDDIVAVCGVAKGTFYLYFQDKSDIRNKLISHKASQLFQSAYAAMKATGITSFEEQIIYMVDFILDKLSKDTMLMTFISKHLSWGVFKNALTGAESGEPCTSSLFVKMLEESGHVFKEPEIMIYLIIELVSGASYSSILYNQPAPLEPPVMSQAAPMVAGAAEPSSIDQAVVQTRRRWPLNFFAAG